MKPEILRDRIINSMIIILFIVIYVLFYYYVKQSNTVNDEPFISNNSFIGLYDEKIDSIVNWMRSIVYIIINRLFEIFKLSHS